ncbi:DUF4030 domain-containing protein [Mesobacillus foraminis]|uniref:DUF4030 domain-containing protein n=1 Tax=Mesobacillus foraminis TaxID=279826 RepID=UPI001BE7104F|nr:DUF4030 domain-containing protein [Mesobacillus foraminis]MBT2757443.1 DUF4030 domain-containing protein [Mesobacillus foraminis]
MSDHLSGNVKKEVDKIKVPEDKLNQTIEFAIKRGKKHNRSLGKKVIFFGSAAVLLLGLFIGSAFVSPVMANVVSKIPFLGPIFANEQDVTTVIFEELKEKGYKVTGGGVSYPKKEIRIEIEGSEKYYQNVKDEVKKIGIDILQSKNYNAYTFKVTRYKQYIDDVDPKQEKEIEQLNREYEIIYRSATKELKSRNFNILSLGMEYKPKTITLEVPSTETRIDEMKNVMNKILKANKLDPIPLNVKKINMKKREQDQRWIEILNIVEDDILGKEEYKVRMVGYSVHPEPEIQAFISLPSSHENAKAFAQQLEKIIDDFLKSEKMKPRVGNDPYYITIYSKDNKIIN